MPEQTYLVYLFAVGGLIFGVVLCLIPALVFLYRKTVQIAALSAEKNALQTTIAARDYDEVRLKEAFHAVSSQVLQENNKSFLDLAQQNLGQFQTEAKGDLAAREKAIADLLKPINDQLGHFKESVAKAVTDAGDERKALKVQVEELVKFSNAVSTDAKNLTEALKGSNKVQGDWGEMILEHLLEASGIRKGIGFTVQKQYEDGEGKKGKPDVILNLPADRCLVVDSKVSIDAYVGYAGTDDPTERDARLKDHIRSIRAHIDGLYGRNYQKLYGIKETPDFVVMFVPVEPAFLLAISRDEKLFMDAWHKNVLLASPSTLLYVLRIVENLWRQEKQALNSREIAERGAKLYDKFVGFAVDFERIGKSLDSARKAYDDAHSVLATGSGNLVRQTEMLRDLGVKPTKNLPPKLLESSAGEPRFLPEGDEEQKVAVAN
ncbi:MAG: DNA recombination protein RmuC [Chthoniobacterales bacterium]|nr:DNA recombination protein RmuC [Chthoniobacterales bacterium]